jgi:acetyltransferase-like isoleucine patch superfamily enzyme
LDKTDKIKQDSLLQEFTNLHNELDSNLLEKYNRSLPLTENIVDRWKRAEKLGFGKGTSIYDSSLVFQPTKVGENCWIGPFTIIDGSGGLTIGNSCTISAGVHIYTHDNVKQTLIGRNTNTPIEKDSVEIGNNTYLAPNVIVAKGVKIGNHCIVATNSFVNKSIEDNTIVAGNPAKSIGEVQIIDNEVKFIYNK